MSATSQPTIELASNIQLGTTANLLYGYQPTWQPGDATSLPLFQPQKQMLNTTSAVVTPDTSATWDDPVITLHPTAESLISTLYNYQVVSTANEGASPAIPSGPLVLDDQDRAQVLQTLTQKLGVDLSDATLSYALVRVMRQVGSATQDAVKSGVFTGRRNTASLIKDEHRLSIPRRLRVGRVTTEPWMTGRLAVGNMGDPDPVQKDIEAFFDFFQTYGTHFVSKIYAGDVIYQVFAYQADAFKAVQSAYANSPGSLSGPLAVNFDYYTSPKGTSGFVNQRGNVLNMSGDPALAESIANGDWQDNQYAGGASIFQAFQPSFPYKLNDRFTQVVAIGFELTSLVAFADSVSKTVWSRVLNAALYQKYGDAIQPVFTNPPTYDFNSIFPGTGYGFVSTIATPTIDVYQERTDLSQMQLIDPESVQSFTAVANVLQASSTTPVQIPGASVTLVAQVFDMGITGSIPTLQLADAAYDSYQMACQDFRGALVMVNTSGSARNVIVDGQRYKLTTDGAVSGRYGVAPDVDVRQSPSLAVLQQITDDIDFSLTTAEALLNARDTSTAQQAHLLILKYLNWIAKAIPEDVTDETLLQLQVRAFYLARVDAKLKLEGVPVPYLNYETYQPLVSSILTVVGTVNDAIRDQQQLIQQRKQAELIINVATELNQNIIQSGQLLTGFISATAAQQGDMVNYYNSVITQQQNQMQQTQAQIANLTTLLQEQQQAVETSVTKYQDAVTDWENQQILNFSLTLASNIFTLGFAVAVPSTELMAVKSLGETAMKIQKALTIFNALNAMYQTLQSNITNLKQAQQALNSVGYDGATLPSSLEWNELSANFQAALNSGPPVPEKNDLSAAFNILVLRGQALLTAQGNIQQIAGEIYSNQQQQQLSQTQQQRLQNLTTMLNTVSVSQLDPSQVDLLGLTSSMQLVQKQMLLMLAKTLVIQDEALQYEYLQQPTAISGFDLLSLEQIMLAQQQSIIAGLSVQPQPEQLPNPITYTVQGIPVSSLTGGNVFKFNIMLSAQEFADYVMVRVTKVIASVSGVKSTDSGEFELDLVFGGAPFQDRDIQRNALTFNTIARQFAYLYDATTGEAKFGTGTGTWSANVSEITPFSQWQVSFPQNQPNAYIAFDGDAVDLTLSFSIEAILKPPTTSMLARAVASPSALSGARPSAMMADFAATATTPPSQAAVVAEMNQIGTVMNNWDVVLNMTEDKVNQILAQQYQQQQGDQTYYLIIPETTSTIGPDPQTGVTQVYKWSLTLGTPSIQFLANNTNSVQINMNILGGSYEYGIIPKGGTYIRINGPTTIDPTSSPTPVVQGSVPLGKVQGDLRPGAGANPNIYSVVLDLSQGSFVAKNLTVITGDPNFNTFLSNYFTTNDIKLLINLVDFTNHTTLPSLTPTTFLLNTMTSQSGINILQLFIVTTGAQQSDVGINLPDPIPEGADSSLLVDTTILFGSIFVDSFNGPSGFRAQYVPPNTSKSLTAPASAQLSAGSVSGNVPATDDMRISANSNQVTIDLTGMTFTPQSTGVLSAYIDRQYTQSFQFWYDPPPPPCGESFGQWEDASLPVTVTINFSMPIVVTGSGNSQSVQIQSSIPSTSIQGTLDSSGPCTCNNRDVQEQFLSDLQSQLPGPLASGVNVTFNAVSLFAIQNLLFPGQYLQMTTAWAPGDLVVFGTINVSSN